MRILVTGAAGMLGVDACRILAEKGHQVLPTARDPAGRMQPLDVTDRPGVQAAFAEARPDVVLHAAAATHVDRCEREPEWAFRINAYGTWVVAAAAEAVGAALVAISTDFVFDGEKGEPYGEWDEPRPINRYGASKWAGENLARQNCRRCYVVRTSWLYGVHGKNFPYAILQAARTRPELTVVDDQVGTPTFTADLVEAIAEIIQVPLYGTYHVTNAGACSWYEFARTILQRAGLEPDRVRPVSSPAYAAQTGSPTRRPRYSVLRRWALEMQNKDDLRPWQAALDDFLSAAKQHGKL